MKSVLAALLITASFAQIAVAGDPAISPAARDRFLEGVHDFAGGKLTPGAEQDPQPRPGGYDNSSAPNYSPAPASWRSSDGKLTGGSIVRNPVTPTPLVGGKIVTPVITPQKITPQNNVSPWGNR